MDVQEYLFLLRKRKFKRKKQIINRIHEKGKNDSKTNQLHTKSEIRYNVKIFSILMNDKKHRRDNVMMFSTK